MMKKTNTALMVAAALGLSASAHAFNVDLFAETAVIEDNTLNGAAVTDFQNEAAVGNIMGGQRDISVDFQSGAEDGAGNRVRMAITYDSILDTNKLSFSNDDGVGGEGRVQWDGDDGGSITLNPTGLGGINVRQ